MKYKKYIFVILLVITLIFIGIKSWATSHEKNEIEMLEEQLEKELKDKNLSMDELTEKMLEEESKYLKPEEMDRLREIYFPDSKNK